jgi:two-component system OmpR family sensor kinase/two-component system sensor histidine kinase CpxA
VRGVFVRIYLAFLLTSLVAAAVTLVLAAYYRHWSNDSVNLIAPTGGYISAAELILQRGGEPLLLEWLLTFERHPSVNAYVFDDRGLSLLPQVPNSVVEYAYSSQNYQALVDPLGRTEILVKAPIMAHNGRIYLLVVEFIHPLAVFNFPEYLAWGFVAAILLFAILGGLLSRYLTRPLVDLQRYVQALGRGNFHLTLPSKLIRRGDEVGALSREFDAMATRLARVLDDQKQLIRDVSHELRSPLARSAVALELARLDACEEQEDALNRIEQENQRLNELIGDLLGMARLEVDQNLDHWQRLDMSDLVDEIVSDARFEHPDGQLAWQPPPMALMVEADPALIRAAAENLIRNALLHTHEGTAVTVTVEAIEHQVRVCVRDRGPGVPESILPDLVRPFVRNEDARERSTEQLGRGHRGFGLGLAIAHRVALHHGGELVLSNHPDGGLQACLMLPLAGVG